MKEIAPADQRQSKPIFNVKSGAVDIILLGKGVLEGVYFRVSHVERS